jgi:hypothetical protein
MNAIGSGSLSATAARWTIAVISCRSPMARRASRSARSACSTATRPSKEGRRRRVPVPGHDDLLAQVGEGERRMRADRAEPAGDAAEGARHPGLEVHQGDPRRPDGDARHARSRLVDLGEIAPGLLGAEETVGGLGVLGRDAVDLGDLGLAADAEHLGGRRLGVDGDRDVRARPQRTHAIRGVADVRRRDERWQHELLTRPREPAAHDARCAVQRRVRVAGRDRRREQSFASSVSSSLRSPCSSVMSAP